MRVSGASYKKYFILACLVLCCFASQALTDKSQFERRTNPILTDTVFNLGNIRLSARVYLPPAYSKKMKRYPVIYLLAESKFDFLNDITADSLLRISTGGKVAAIIIQFNLDSTSTVESMVPFIAGKLKPHIDRYYRTLSSGENSIIAGFGSAAAIALGVTLQYPSLFGKAGLMYPDFTGLSAVKDSLFTRINDLNGMIFIHSNQYDSTENGGIIQQVIYETGRFSKAYLYNFMEEYNSDFIFLQPCFFEFYRWILSDGHSYIIDPGKKRSGKQKLLRSHQSR